MQDRTNVLFFDSVTHPGRSVMVSGSKLCRNQGGVLEGIVPHGLEAGESYRIRVYLSFCIFCLTFRLFALIPTLVQI